MFDELEFKSTGQKQKTLNLLPIVDMLTTIIFFLLLSTTFFHYTKQTLPPSTVARTSMAKSPPPLSLKVLGKLNSKNQVSLKFSWKGERPSSLMRTYGVSLPLDRSGASSLVQSISTQVSEVAKIVGANDKTIRISFQKQAPYQVLISTMDAMKKSFPDMVLAEWGEAENEL